MRNYNKSLLIAVLISLVSLILLLMWRERSKSKLEFDNQLKVGDKVTLPDYVYGIDGRKIYFNNNLVLFIFFDPNCSVCIDEIPVWNYFYSNYKNKIAIIGVSYSNINTLKKFSIQHDVLYPIVFDSGRKLFKMFNVSRIPSVFLVADGRVEMFLGEDPSASINLKKLREYIEKKILK